MNSKSARFSVLSAFHFPLDCNLTCILYILYQYFIKNLKRSKNILSNCTFNILQPRYTLQI